MESEERGERLLRVKRLQRFFMIYATKGIHRLSLSPSVGLKKRMLEYANRNGITLGSKDIYMGSKSISHTMRETKRQKRLAISEGDLISFPVSRRKMELFYDGEGFIYTDRKSKYIIHPNYKIETSNGKTRKAMFVTAGRVNDPREFENPKYKKV